ncbi:ATP-grasp fold amidoligase family protein [Burkholderia ubonensis]|uniref:ATP-grasp fold amidoligase family protein n=1 Tax=Burkholderia ubonensis TaxID=101571 RepID=UPI000ABE9011|nr:ATP-grasp fold amidoligase family protein [Burkholderia ubonensis]
MSNVDNERNSHQNENRYTRTPARSGALKMQGFLASEGAVAPSVAATVRHEANRQHGVGSASMWAYRKFLQGVKRCLPDWAFLMLSHRRKIGRFPNLTSPKAFNELILTRSLNPAIHWSELADKLSVREYVRHKIGEQYLIPLVAVPEAFTREVFDMLPSSFVMKANHGCGFVKVVRDKGKTSFKELSALAAQWMAANFYHTNRERHYRNIKPRIYFEKLLVDSNDRIPADLKLHVFGRKSGGPVIYTIVISDRFGDIRGDVYDAQWNRLDLSVGEYTRSDAPARLPANWDDVVRVATLLAEDFGYLRVDLYSTGSDIYFGELTFTPGAGLFRFNPDRFDYDWGRLLRETMENVDENRTIGSRKI